MATFEEAIHRVYDRTLQCLPDDEEAEEQSVTTKVFVWIERGTLALFFFYLFALLVLHGDINRNPGCLPRLLEENRVAENRTLLFPNDAILQINIDSQYKYPSSDAPDPNGEGLGLGDERRERRRRLQPLFSTGRNEKNRSPLLLSTMAACLNIGSSVKETLVTTISRLLGTTASDHSSSPSSHKVTSAGNESVNATFVLPIPVKYLLQYDYEFATDVGVLSLSNELRAKHDFPLINITMNSQDCFGDSPLASFFVPLGGVDTVVMNSIVATIQKGGMLTTYQSEYYLWRDTDVVLYHHSGEWVSFKFIMACKIFFLFFILSNVTALLVRILISSGAICIYAVLMCCSNGPVINRIRHLTHAYPWLGIPIELYAARQQSPMPFVWGQVAKIAVYYTLYEALQFAVCIWFYDNNQPGQKELWLFAAMMIWEYYTMVSRNLPQCHNK